jgi:hypothetical protein
MAAPIYFFPKTRPDALVAGDRLRERVLAEWGAAHAFLGITSIRAQTSLNELSGKGPGGQSGTLLQVIPPGEPPMRIGFYPDHQDWHEAPAGCRAWVGIDREYSPRPADLVRVADPAGHNVQLGDGHTWKVPIIREPFNKESAGRSQLTRDFTFDSSGRLVFVRQSSDDRLWELSGVAWDHFFEREKQPTLDMEEMVELILGALAINYRIGKPEAQLLRLFNTKTWSPAVEAILDTAFVDDVLAAQKKT